MPSEDNMQSFFLPKGSAGYKKQMENLNDEYEMQLLIKKARDNNFREINGPKPKDSK